MFPFDLRGTAAGFDMRPPTDDNLEEIGESVYVLTSEHVA